MIWRRSENSSSVDRRGESFGRRLEGMGQLSSSELPTVAKAVAVVRSEIPSTELGTKREIGSEAARFERMVIKPSQPIDICRGQPPSARSAQLNQLQRTAQRLLLQRSASEMAPMVQKCPSVVQMVLPSAQKQHQPRVVQPRRLVAINNGTLATTIDSMSTARMISQQKQREMPQAKTVARRHDNNDHQNVNKRSRGVTVGIPPQWNCQKEGQNGGGELNKENSDGERINSSGSSSSKSSRSSRKRLNSLELGNLDLDYDALEGTSSDAKTDEKGQQKENETKPTQPEHIKCEECQMENDGISTPPVQKTDNGTNGTVRRRAEGGRIAYLYGVYGACGDASATAFGANGHFSQRHRRPAFSDQANIVTGGSVCWDDCCCCCLEDEEQPDELFSTTQKMHGCVVHNLNSVSDIIGYAKVIRAQRNETLGRLNDVMSQFDALIRSYSLTMQGGTDIQQPFDVAEGQPIGGNGSDSANGAMPTQTQLEPAA